jgi:outer membrane murein-binding lipoprotein Lpp
MIAEVRAALLTTLVAASVPAVANGQEASYDSLAHRIVVLESKTADLEQRVRTLEALIKAAPSQAWRAPGSANWRDRANWRRLRRGMTEDQVRAILGEPENVLVVSSRTVWSWGETPKGASLYFDDDKLAGWSEPSQ